MPSSSVLLASLLAAAIRLSGLPGIDADELPPLVRMTEDELAQTVCPDGGCRSLAAVFDTERYRILLRDSLKLDDPVDNSFLVHEFVHVLQFQRHGHARFSSCQKVLSSEREAYAVQNAYLREFGVFSPEGDMTRFMRCPPEQKEATDDATPPAR